MDHSISPSHDPPQRKRYPRHRTSPQDYPPSEYMTIEEVAVLMRRDVKTIRNYMVDKRLKLNEHYVRPGGTGHPLLKRVKIIAFIEGEIT